MRGHHQPSVLLRRLRSCAEPRWRKVLGTAVTTVVLGIVATRIDGLLPGSTNRDALTPLPDADLRVHLTYREAGSEDESTEARAAVGRPGRLSLQVRNVGGRKAENLSVRLALPPELRLVARSTRIYNADNRHGVDAGTDGLVGSGVRIGSYAPASNAYVTARVVAVRPIRPRTFATIVGSADANNISEVHDTLEAYPATPGPG